MKDFLKNELEVGDTVVYLEHGTSNSWLAFGEIVRFTPQKVVLKSTKHRMEFRRDPYGIIKS